MKAFVISSDTKRHPTLSGIAITAHRYYVVAMDANYQRLLGLGSIKTLAEKLPMKASDAEYAKWHADSDEDSDLSVSSYIAYLNGADPEAEAKAKADAEAKAKADAEAKAKADADAKAKAAAEAKAKAAAAK